MERKLQSIELRRSVVLACVGTLTAFAPGVSVQSAATAQQRATEGERRWTQAELERISLEIQADLEELRGEKFKRPVAVRVSNKEDLIEYAKMREAKLDSPEKFAADEQIAKLLGAVPVELDLRAKSYELLQTQVLGFYDPDTDSFSLMESTPIDVTRITLAHELDHALDDQLFDIDGTLKRIGSDTDAQLAYHAVIEGSGTAAMTQWTLANQSSLDLQSVDASDMAQLAKMAEAPMWAWKPMMGAYFSGAAFLQRSENWLLAQAKAINNPDIRAAFETPPLSTEQILHPAKYWDPAQRDDPTRVHIETSKLADGWKLLREDTLGEMMIAVLCTPAEERANVDLSNPAAYVALAFTNPIATGWDGDRIVLLGKDEARVLRWNTVWDSERDAGEFFGSLHAQRHAFEAAAHAIAGGSEDAGAAIEYGAKPNEVTLTIHAGVRRSDLRRVLRTLEPATR